MIIGVVGPVPTDIQMITELISDESQFQVVDCLDVVRQMDRKHINSMTSKSYHKQFFLKSLENIFGVCIFTGNLVLSPEICRWIIQTGGVIVVVSRNELESYDNYTLEQTGNYWEDPAIQRYELVNRFKKLYETLASEFGINNLFKIDLSEENSEDLSRLVEFSQEWIPSTKTTKDTRELLKIVTGKEDNTMTMEESIKQAMRELGVDFGDAEASETPVKTSKPTTKPQNTRPKNPSKVEKKTEEPHEGDDFTEIDTQTQELEPPQSLFVKLTDTTMALLIPEGLKMETQVIGGDKFLVATVSIPDFHSHKLQELELDGSVSQNQKKPEKSADEKPVVNSEVVPENKPIKPELQVSSPTNTHEISEDLSKLQAEKARLDAEIKKYRSEGNLDMVNNLRKQRRVIRGKINSLK